MVAGSRYTSQNYHSGYRNASYYFSVLLTSHSYDRIDDLEEGPVLENGVPALHVADPVPQMINSANYIYLCALRELGALGNPQVFKIFSGKILMLKVINLDELIALHRGQGMDLFWRSTLTCPDVKEYIESIKNKKGWISRLSIRLMQAQSLNSVYSIQPNVTDTEGLHSTDRYTRDSVPDSRGLPESSGY
jgi:Polyprenyl synthetase